MLWLGARIILVMGVGLLMGLHCVHHQVDGNRVKKDGGKGERERRVNGIDGIRRYI